jgi:hypothetical protein
LAGFSALEGLKDWNEGSNVIWNGQWQFSMILSAASVLLYVQSTSGRFLASKDTKSALSGTYRTSHFVCLAPHFDLYDDNACE